MRCQVRAQFPERRVVAALDPLAQQLVMTGLQSRDMAAAVRTRGEVLPCAVQAQHLVDEGSADAEQPGHFRDRAVATQCRDKNTLAQIEGIGFHGAASYFS